METGDDTVLFYREDTGETVTVPYGDALDMDITGRLERDGVVLRKVQRGQAEAVAVAADRTARNGRPIVSDNLGFGAHQFAEFEHDRKSHGFTGVEFVRDKDVPDFYQVHVSSRGEWDRYVAHRGLVDRNRSSGTVISAEGLREAEQRVRRQYGAAA